MPARRTRKSATVPGFRLSGTSRTGPAPIDASAAAEPTRPRSIPPCSCGARRSDPVGKQVAQVLRIRYDDADEAPVLIVEDVAERASSAERWLLVGSSGPGWRKHLAFDRRPGRASDLR